MFKRHGMTQFMDNSILLKVYMDERLEVDVNRELGHERKTSADFGSGPSRKGVLG